MKKTIIMLGLLLVLMVSLVCANPAISTTNLFDLKAKMSDDTVVTTQVQSRLRLMSKIHYSFVDSLDDVVITEETDILYVEGTKEVKFLGLFNLQRRYKLTVNAQEQVIYQHSWHDFLWQETIPKDDVVVI